MRRGAFCTFMIKVFGKKLIETFNHYIRCLKWENFNPVTEKRLTPFELTPQKQKNALMTMLCMMTKQRFHASSRKSPGPMQCANISAGSVQ